jgi:hypothetical protein
MKKFCVPTLALLFVFASFAGVVHAQEEGDAVSLSESDWGWWRGPTWNGVAPSNQNPPLQWGADKNVLWKTPVPGRGHGSPTVVGERVYLAVADEDAELQSVMCFDRKTGEQRWKTDIHKGGFKSVGRQGHVKSTKASSTVACDGERIFINFINDNAVYTTTLSLDGEQLWQQKVTDYTMHQGYGSSPTIYGSLVIVSADNKGGGAITGFDRATGDVVWTVARPERPNYTSPVILNIAGQDQLVFTGSNLVSSFNPMTGKVNWEVEGATTECVTSVVTDGSVVVTSGGYPDKHISVVRADGSGDVVWENGTEVYVPSMLVREGHLYAVTDRGVAICYNLSNGDVVWEHRLGSKFTSSPVLVGENIYITSNDGITYIFKASPKGFEQVGQNKLADHVIATPAICGSRVYMRVAHVTDDNRQEMLYCLAQGG